MDWYKLELPFTDHVSFESRWLVTYSRNGAPPGLFIFKSTHGSDLHAYFVPEPVTRSFPDFFRSFSLQKCSPPNLDAVIPLGGTEAEVRAYYQDEE